jgi:hypothetical protein
MGNCNHVYSQETHVKLWKYETSNLLGIGSHYAVEVDGEIWEFAGAKEGKKVSINMGVGIADTYKKHVPHHVHNKLAYADKTWEKKSRAQMEEFCHRYASMTAFDYELIVDNGLDFAMTFIDFLVDGQGIPFESSVFEATHGNLEFHDNMTDEVDTH